MAGSAGTRGGGGNGIITSGVSGMPGSASKDINHIEITCMA